MVNPGEDNDKARSANSKSDGSQSKINPLGNMWYELFYI